MTTVKRFQRFDCEESRFFDGSGPLAGTSFLLIEISFHSALSICYPETARETMGSGQVAVTSHRHQKGPKCIKSALEFSWPIGGMPTVAAIARLPLPMPNGPAAS